MKRDLTLVLASDSAKAGEEPFPLDRLRLQKAIFLISMRGTERLREMYHFDPYNWGPYSRDLTADVRDLMSTGDLTERQTGPGQHGSYETTYAGEERSAQAWNELTQPERNFIRAIRAYVTNQSFNHLLREVYAEYPAYASKSQFRG